jgi:hypothetical protein
MGLLPRLHSRSAILRAAEQALPVRVPVPGPGWRLDLSGSGFLMTRASRSVHPLA